MEEETKQNYKNAGKIAREVIEYAKSIIKKDMLLLEIADKIEDKIIELGGKPAFPTNLSINEIAAHYTPMHNDETKASGLLKVDLGVAIEGCVADVAFSLDLEGSEENKNLILASEEALKSAINEIGKGVELFKIGKKIQETIEARKYTPIVNLCGHEIREYNLHAGLTLPNYNNNSTIKINEGVFAIEPFATNGEGKVIDGGHSGIYKTISEKTPRDANARKVLKFIEEEYRTLPFCSRWLVKKFGAGALISLSFLEKDGIIYQFPQLVERGRGKVAQTENTVLISDKVEALA